MLSVERPPLSSWADQGGLEQATLRHEHGQLAVWRHTALRQRGSGLLENLESEHMNNVPVIEALSGEIGSSRFKSIYNASKVQVMNLENADQRAGTPGVM